MEIKVQNYNNTISSNYNNKKNSTISFQDCLNKVNTSDKDQTLIEDKKVYDSLKSISDKSMSNIEFGSKEWDKWKVEHTDNYFPPLNAPAAVREAWSEVEESIPAGDTKTKNALRHKELLFFAQSHHPEIFELPANFQLNTIDNYKTLFNIDITRSEKFAEMFKNTSEGDKFALDAKLIKNVEAKLDEKLFNLN